MKKCEQCGKEYSDDYAFCPECGGELSLVEELIEEDNSNRCPVCGEEVTEGYEFCPYCGASLNQQDNAGEYPEGQRPCPYCGKMISNDYDFCPECGKRIAFSTDALGTKTSNESVFNAPPVQAQKPKSKKTKIIVGAIVAAVAIIAISLFGIMTPKELTINGGDPIKVYVGDKEKIDYSGDGVSDGDGHVVTWTIDNEDVLKITDGKVKARYDSDSFNEITGEGDDVDMDPCRCTTFIHAEIKDGLRTWKGTAEVNISLKPKKFKSGDIIKKPADARISSITITPTKDANVYFYLKSKTKKANDMSFIVKKGKTTTVAVPADNYRMYWANGDTWYGGKYLFGPQTTYRKDNEDWDFRQGTWTLTMGVSNGNMETNSIDEDDFPDL